MNAGLAERPAKKNRELRKLEKEREELLERLQEVTQAIKDAQEGQQQSAGLDLGRLRLELGWTRARIASVLNASERAIVYWEKGEAMSPVYAAKLREFQDIVNEVGQLMDRKEVGKWLLSDLEEFDGQAAADLIRRGETGRVWTSYFI